MDMLIPDTYINRFIETHIEPLHDRFVLRYIVLRYHITIFYWRLEEQYYRISRLLLARCPEFLKLSHSAERAVVQGILTGYFILVFCHPPPLADDGPWPPNTHSSSVLTAWVNPGYDIISGFFLAILGITSIISSLVFGIGMFIVLFCIICMTLVKYLILEGPSLCVEFVMAIIYSPWQTISTTAFVLIYAAVTMAICWGSIHIALQLFTFLQWLHDDEVDILEWLGIRRALEAFEGPDQILGSPVENPYDPFIEN